MIFEIDNIELNHGGKQILNGIYLKAETGKITGILGNNGTGKSSLLNIIFGNLQPLHKLIRINSQVYIKLLFSSGLVKYLPQQRLIPPYLQIDKVFKLYKVNWKDFLVDFPEFSIYRKSRMHEVSSGQQRTLETYLILKTPSQLLLLDEPFSHLSPLSIEKFQHLLQEEKKRKAILITDHRYYHVIQTADELYLLKNGCSQYIIDPLELEEYRYLNPNSL